MILVVRCVCGRFTTGKLATILGCAHLLNQQIELVQHKNVVTAHRTLGESLPRGGVSLLGSVRVKVASAATSTTPRIDVQELGRCTLRSASAGAGHVHVAGRGRNFSRVHHFCGIKYAKNVVNLAMNLINSKLRRKSTREV